MHSLPAGERREPAQIGTPWSRIGSSAGTSRVASKFHLTETTSLRPPRKGKFRNGRTVQKSGGLRQTRLPEASCRPPQRKRCLRPDREMLRIKKIGPLPRVALAIALGILCAFWMPSSLSRVFATFNELFGNFLGFAIPLIVFGLVASGIAELGTGAGRLLGITTLLAGFFAYFVCLWCYPPILGSEASLGSLETAGVSRLVPYFTVEMPPIADVTSALLLSFVLGLGTARGGGNTLKKGLSEFRDVIGRIIERAIVPLLPLYIFGIFLKMGAEGQVAGILSLFLKIIALIFAMHLLLLLFQYGLAGIVSRRNPLKLLRTMLPAYMTALGTQSSAATIPVTLERTIRNGVNPELAGFVIPLNATIHLSGSILKIVACALAIIVDDRHADPYGSVRRVHRHAGRYDDRRPGRSGRRHHGRARPAAVDARLR